MIILKSLLQQFANNQYENKGCKFQYNKVYYAKLVTTLKSAFCRKSFILKSAFCRKRFILED